MLSVMIDINIKATATNMFLISESKDKIEICTNTQVRMHQKLHFLFCTSDERTAFLSIIFYI